MKSARERRRKKQLGANEEQAKGGQSVFLVKIQPNKVIATQEMTLQNLIVHFLLKWTLDLSKLSSSYVINNCILGT